jgi:hypothetical protein
MKNVILFMLPFLIIICGCEENSSGGGDDPMALSLLVTDSSGDPVSGVDFHYIYYTGTDIVYRNATIQYALPATDTVTLRIYDPYGQLISTLLDHHAQAAGIYQYFYDGAALTNGIYEYRLILSDTSFTGKFFICTDDPALLKSLPALGHTDQNGKLTINYSVLGVGSTFPAPQSDLGYIAVSDSITILLFKPGYFDYSEGIKIKINTITEKTIELILDFK